MANKPTQGDQFGKTKGQEGYGSGSTNLSAQDVREAYSLFEQKDKTGKRPSFADSPICKGVSGPIKRRLEEAQRDNRQRFTLGAPMVRHATEATGDKSPKNSLLLQDRKPIEASLFELPTAKGERFKVQVGESAKYDMLGLLGWFGGAVDSPLPVTPGLDVRSDANQIVGTIPPVKDIDPPQNDLNILLTNTAEAFRGLLAIDNEAEIVREKGYTPHSVPNLHPAEAAVFNDVPGTREVALDLNHGFSPEGNTSDPYAVLLFGEGVYVSRSDSDRHRGRTLQQMLDAGVVPLAQLKAPKGQESGQAFAFQLVGLKGGREKASAVFFPTKAGSFVQYVPLGDDPVKRLIVMKSLAELAASMHTHNAHVEAGQDVLTKVQKSAAKGLQGLRGLLGL